LIRVNRKLISIAILTTQGFAATASGDEFFDADLMPSTSVITERSYEGGFVIHREEPPKKQVVTHKASELTAWGEQSVTQFIKSATSASAPKQEAGPAIVSSSAGTKNAKNGTGLATLTVDLQNGSANISPSAVAFEKIGDSILIKTIHPAQGVQNAISMFVRDQDIAQIVDGGSRLVARQKGATELYVVRGERMIIVPVKIGAAKEGALEIPDQLLTLDDLIKSNQLQSASMVPSIPAAESAGSSNTEVASENADATVANAEISEADAEESVESKPVRMPLPKQQYVDVELQLIDERSVTAERKNYPVSGVVVAIPGIGFSTRTDARGIAVVRAVPDRSTLSIVVEGQSTHRDVVAEIQVSRAVRHVIMVPRNVYMEANERIADTAARSDAGTVCGKVMSRSQKTGFEPLRGIAIRSDITADGPFYFNDFGDIDPSANGTYANGAFCFFNVAPGLVVLSAVDVDGSLGSVGTFAVAGTYHNVDLEIFGDAIQIAVAASPSAHEELAQLDREILRPLEFTNIQPFGVNGQFAYSGPSRLVWDGDALGSDGVVSAGVQDTDFEQTVFTIDYADPSSSPIVVYPRGYVEDMSVYADIPFEVESGSIIVRHANAEGKQGRTQMRLVSLSQEDFGRTVASGWVYADERVAKGIFFNIPAGAYVVVVEDDEQHWFSYNQVLVYSETATVISTGAQR